jgi:hypothetical protein
LVPSQGHFTSNCHESLSLSGRNSAHLDVRCWTDGSFQLMNNLSSFIIYRLGQNFNLRDESVIKLFFEQEVFGMIE